MALFAGALSAVFLPAFASAGDWKLEAGITARETWTDNVNLAPANPQSDFITELSPYVSASRKGGRLEADVHYRMQNLFYADQSARNRINHQLAGRAGAELVEQEVFLEAHASVSQQIATLLGAVPADTISATGNLVDVYSLNVSPYWQHRFGTTAKLLARYSHGELSYGGGGFSNASTDGVTLSLASGTAFDDLFWSLDHLDVRTDYATRPDVHLATTRATVGYQFTARLRASASVGYQDASYAAATTALSGGIWSVGVSFAPTNRTTLGLSYGSYPFGKTHGFDFKHRTAYTRWAASYDESLTTTASQFSSLQTVGLVNPSTGQLVGVIINPQTVLTDVVYLNKAFRGSVAYGKGKSELSLSAFHTTQESMQGTSITSALGAGVFAATRTLKHRAATAAWDWRISPVLTSSLGFTVGHMDFVDIGRRDTYTRLRLELKRQFNADLSASLGLRHQERASNQAGVDATENAVLGTVNYKF